MIFTRTLFVSLLSLLFCAFTVQASGQEGNETILTLSVEASEEVIPDSLRANLRIEVEAPSAMEAQNHVNARMVKAIAQLKENDALKVSTQGYHVYERHERDPRDHNRILNRRWIAQQNFALVSTDQEAVKKAVGLLQGEGFLLQGLNFEMSYMQKDALDTRLMIQALKSLKVQVQSLSEALELTFTHFASIDTRTDEAGPVIPYARGERLMAFSASAAPPVAEVSGQRYTVQVEAEAVLE